MSSENRRSHAMQKSFSIFEYETKKKQTRRDRFLGELERTVPWKELEEVIAPHYPRSKGPGRPAIGLSRILKMYVAQQCFGLSDEGIEDAVYDSQAIRKFVGIDICYESAPDETTILKFRHLLEEHNLTKTIFEKINEHLSAKGLILREGTIVDATLIAAAPSIKNKTKSRDPEMHQSKKGNQWYFGMKAHIGVDMENGMVHTVVATAGNVSDVAQAHTLLHGDEKHVMGDAGYTGIEKREENLDKTEVEWHIAEKPSKIKKITNEIVREAHEKLERAKASIRSKVEHPFHVVKNLFKHRKARYRGLAKNEAQLFTLFGLANLVLARQRLLI
jgi:IS5 family transposase